MIYIAVCLSRSEGESENFLVKDKKGNTVFRDEATANASVQADMRDYLRSERESGMRARIVGNRIEWDDYDNDREAVWYVYEIDPTKAVSKQKGKK